MKTSSECQTKAAKLRTHVMDTENLAYRVMFEGLAREWDAVGIEASAHERRAAFIA